MSAPKNVPRVRVILVIEDPKGNRRYIGPYRSVGAAESASTVQRQWVQGEKWSVEPLLKIDTVPAPPSPERPA